MILAKWFYSPQKALKILGNRPQNTAVKPILTDFLHRCSCLNDLRANINSLTVPIIDQPFFRDVFQSPLIFTCPEAGFLRTVSWLYTLYNEAGKINIEFILSRAKDYNLGADNHANNHMQIIHNLRTFLQHSMDIAENRNSDMKRRVEDWIGNSCGHLTPSTEMEWGNCLLSIINQSQKFLSLVQECVINLSNDEFAGVIAEEWKNRLSRYHPPHKFERIIAIVAADLGRDHIDPIKLCKQHHSFWVKQMELLPPRYDFETEARRLIEHVLLINPTLPITSQEIIERLDIPPGARLGKAISRAREIYSANPCSKEELLTRMKAEEL